MAWQKSHPNLECIDSSSDDAVCASTRKRFSQGGCPVSIHSQMVLAGMMSSEHQLAIASSRDFSLWAKTRKANDVEFESLKHPEEKCLIFSCLSSLL